MGELDVFEFAAMLTWKSASNTLPDAERMRDRFFVGIEVAFR
jgi:hypothetical protein